MSQTNKRLDRWSNFGYIGSVSMARKRLRALSLDKSMPLFVTIRAHSVANQLDDLEEHLRKFLGTKLDSKGNPRK